MANEITVALSVSVSQNGNTVGGNAPFRANAQVDGFIGSEQSIPTGGTTLNFGNVAAPQLVFVENLDPDNYVEIDANSGFDGFPQKILPGQGIFLLPETAVIHARANTAAVLVWVVAA